MFALNETGKALIAGTQQAVKDAIDRGLSKKSLTPTESLAGSLADPIADSQVDLRFTLPESLRQELKKAAQEAREDTSKARAAHMYGAIESLTGIALDISTGDRLMAELAAAVASTEDAEKLVMLAETMVLPIGRMVLMMASEGKPDRKSVV